LQLKLQPKADTAAAKALRFDAAVVGLDSDASLNAATPQSMLLFAQGNLSWTTQGDSHWAAQHTVSVNSGDATTLFTHDGGMHVIAANAPVSIAAHTDAMEVFADQSINVTSTNNAILVEAQQKIVLQAGQSAIVLDGGNITFTCPGTFSVKGATHPFSGGGSDAAVLGALPNTIGDIQLPSYFEEDELEQYFEFINASTGEAITGLQYRIENTGSSLVDKAQLEEGKTQSFSITTHPEELSLTAWIPLGGLQT
jgi:type VI secretion system secreted protein VgrG